MPQQPENSDKREVLDAEIVDAEPRAGNSNRRAAYANNTVWVASPLSQGSCGAASVTILLFLICLAQYGLLAGIGFLVFHIIGAGLGTVYQARKLMVGIIANPWAWRIGNWCVSLLLTVWLAGGFND